MAQLDVEKARYNMIEQQVRTWGVLDARVLEVMAAVPREHFVQDSNRALAFADTEIPIGYGQTMLAPKVEGRMLQALRLRPTDSVLEIGTGSGYVTACLAQLAGRVVTVDDVEELSQTAQSRVAALGIGNVGFRVGNAAEGWSQDGSFDAIAVTASMPRLIEAFQRQLIIGGRLFAVVGTQPVMEALLITRTSATEWTTEGLFETYMPALRGIAPVRQFAF